MPSSALQDLRPCVEAIGRKPSRRHDELAAGREFLERLAPLLQRLRAQIFAVQFQ
jgi:hypothetical protein